MSSEVLEKLAICGKIDGNMKQSIKLLHVFDEYDKNGKNFETNALFVTNDDLVYGLGRNLWGCLGLGHNSAVDSPKLIPELCHKNIQYFVKGMRFVLAVNAENHIYSWGQNA